MSLSLIFTAQIPNCYPQQLNRDVVKLWKSKDLGYKFYNQAVAVDNRVALNAPPESLLFIFIGEDMIHGECQDCGRNSWLNSKYLCGKCASKDRPDRAVALKRWLYVFCHKILRMHYWLTIKDTGVTKYLECGYCKRRRVKQLIGGYQPIDWEYLGYTKELLKLISPKSFMIEGKWAVYPQVKNV